MTDEATTPTPEQEHNPAEEEQREETAVATEEQPGEEEKEKEEEKIDQTVDIVEVGPCKKHIKVTIAHSTIEKLLNEKYSELMKDAVIPGFRKGRAPRRFIEKQFHKDVAEQIRGQLLAASLEQMAEDHEVAPIAEPDFDPRKVEVPLDGPLIYEFDVEVRPEFQLPEYKGMKLKRPVREISAEDIDREERRILSHYGQLVPKDGPAEMDDYIIVDMTTRKDDRIIGEVKEVTLRVDRRLAFKDGVAEHFGEQVAGAQAGETRMVDIKMSDNVATRDLAGQTLEATLEVKDVKELRLPELTHEFFHNLGVHSREELRDEIQALLERRLEYHQRQSARQQILQQIEEHSKFDLPQDLLVRQARRALNRRAMEMQDAGMSEEEIQGQLRLLQQDIVRNTAMSLKEHFVLQKIAEEEDIDVSDEEMNQEIEVMAEEAEESPRRVRARLEREGQLETLAAMIIERKALDLILKSAVYEDVPMEKPDEESVAVSEEQAVEGELRDVTAEAEAAAKAEKEAREKGAEGSEAKGE